MADQQVIKREYILTAKQKAAWVILSNMDEKMVALCYGGAKGGGKSFLFCLWVFMWCRKLITLFKINEPLKYPLVVGFIGRKRAVDFNKTTLETWKRIIPSQCYRIREQQKEIIIEEKVTIWYGGLDDQENINKFNSAELAFVGVDQSEETEETELGTLEASLRLRYNGIEPPYRKFYSANPADCHIKYRFVKPMSGPVPGEYFVPALYSDNPYLPANYRETLERAYSYDTKILRAYRDGDWDILLPSNLLVTTLMLENLKGIVHHEPITKKIIACDPSFGGDECVIKVFYNTKCVEKQVLHERDQLKVAAFLSQIGDRHDIRDYVVDGIGPGQGVIVGLRSLSKNNNVIDIQSGEPADDNEHFTNRKAEMWAFFAQEVLNKKVEAIEDAETRRQLVAVHYKLVSSRMQIEPKSDTKKTLGRSPDDADCHIYGIWGLSQIEVNVRGEVVLGDRQGRGERVNDIQESQYINIR